jgi:hypothetical protein
MRRLGTLLGLRGCTSGSIPSGANGTAVSLPLSRVTVGRRPATAMRSPTVKDLAPFWPTSGQTHSLEGVPDYLLKPFTTCVGGTPS